MTPRKTDLKALRNMIAEAQRILATTMLPEGRSERASELLTAAVHLAGNLLIETPAAVLGKKGGAKTAERGPEYFRKIAAKRKTFWGRKASQEAQLVLVFSPQRLPLPLLQLLYGRLRRQLFRHRATNFPNRLSNLMPNCVMSFDGRLLPVHAFI